MSNFSRSNLLQLKDGVKTFGFRTLFANASFSINESEKIGVIGPNGAGKSTLFRILMGEERLDSGEITRASGLRVGYLAQDDRQPDPAQKIVRDESTVEDYLMRQSVTPIWELKRMSPSFGLNLEHFSRSLSSLSGGYRMRVKLLELIASQPDLMLLDEPTNYLDLETLVVLENFLQSYKGAFLLISHDREFLRRVTDHILEIESGEMTKFAGHIDDYFEQKELLRVQIEKAAVSAQAKRKEIIDFANRFGAKATKAKQVQSRLRQLERMETIEVKALPVKAQIRLPEPTRTGRSIIRLDGVDLGYGQKVVLSHLNLELNRGDHLGIVGVNGAGKSTLLKTLAGELAPLKGQLAVGQGVSLGYFAQHVAERLRPQDTVLEAMGEFAHPDTKKQEILDLAGCLLFSGDTVNKQIRILSGGEKSRVALGQILLKRASCLLLDEPTNHLDFDTVEALTQALAQYPGCVVIVSHDRGFVRRTASKILEIRGGAAELYPGTYEEYVWSVQKGVLADREQNASLQQPVQSTSFKVSMQSPRPISSSSTGTPSQSPSQLPSQSQSQRSQGQESLKQELQHQEQAVENRFNFKEQKKKLEKECRSLERQMASLETEMERLRAVILDFNDKLSRASGPSAAELAREIGTSQTRIEEMESAYLESLERHDAVSLELEGMLNRRTD